MRETDRERERGRGRERERERERVFVCVEGLTPHDVSMLHHGSPNHLIVYPVSARVVGAPQMSS